MKAISRYNPLALNAEAAYNILIKIQQITLYSITTQKYVQLLPPPAIHYGWVQERFN